MCAIINTIDTCPVNELRYHCFIENSFQILIMGNAAKILPLGPVFAVMLALAGCGGGAADATVGGTVVGLSGGTNVGLLDNGGDPITVSANGNFSFDQKIQSGSAYAVTVQNQPIGETCTIANGSGTIDGEGDDVTNITVSCYATGTQP